MNLTHILKQILLEEKKKADRCKRIADRKFNKPSAYKSGAIVRCRQGKIWKDIKEEAPIPGKNSSAYKNLIGEGWKENILAAIALAAGVGLNSPAKANTINNITNIKRSIKSDKQNFFAACLQFSAELNQGADMGFEQKKGLTEAGLYFQSMRDNQTPKKLSEAGAAAVKAIESTVMQMNSEKFNKLVQKGLTATINAEIIENYLYEAKKETLRTWFKRKGAPGKTGGWVDCNTCRNGKCKPCGRQKGEKRAKYPSCRPTPAACKDKGKGKTWGKTK